MTTFPETAPESIAGIPEYLAAFTNYETQRSLPADRRELGPARARALLEALGLLPTRVPVVQVAGSKGKGSTVLWMEALLRARGYQPGCYLSPHLTRLNERVRIGGNDIEDSALLSALSEVHEALPECTHGPTFFDLWTVLAMTAFRRAQVTHTLLEVGLGGPLDSTSAVPHDIGVLTAIDLEHSRELGPTCEAIATEKSRIATSGKPFVVAEPSATPSIEAPVRAAGAIWTPVPGEDRRVPENIPGCQQSNLRTALCALEALADLTPFSPSEVRTVVETTVLPARLEARGRLLIDSAHTPRSFAAFVQAFHRHSRGTPGTILVAFLEGKQWPTILEHAHRELPDQRWICTRAPSPRSEPPQHVADHLASLGASAVAVEDPEQALGQLQNESGPIAVAGSTYLAGLARR